MELLIAGAFFLIAAGTAAIQVLVRMRTLNSHRRPATEVNTNRYRPMLRLLSDEDSHFGTDAGRRRKLRTQRCRVFREYLDSLGQDYGQLLAGLRLVMVQSGVDRPDLAKALFRNRVLFAIALCRIDFSLRLYSLGIGNAETLRTKAAGLVDAVNVLQGQFSFLAESAVWGA